MNQYYKIHTVLSHIKKCYLFSEVYMFSVKTKMVAEVQDFLFRRDNSLRKDESNDVVKPQCHFSNDSPFKGRFLKIFIFLIDLEKLFFPLRHFLYSCSTFYGFALLWPFIY